MTEEIGQDPETGEFYVRWPEPYNRIRVRRVRWYPPERGLCDEWGVWIPYTKPEHLDAPWPDTLEEWNHIVEDAPILGPWGDTYWPTWREAYDFAYRVATEGTEKEEAANREYQKRWKEEGR